MPLAFVRQLPFALFLFLIIQTGEIFQRLYIHSFFFFLMKLVFIRYVINQLVLSISFYGNSDSRGDSFQVYEMCGFLLMENIIFIVLMKFLDR